MAVPLLEEPLLGRRGLPARFMPGFERLEGRETPAVTASFIAGAGVLSVFGDNLVAQGIFLGLGKLAFDIMYLVFEGRLAMSDLLIQLLLWSPLSALVTGLTGVLVLATFRISLESRP